MVELSNAQRRSSSLEHDFAGTSYLVLLGPINPVLVDDVASRETSLWASFGLFNVVAHTADEREADALTHWAASQGAPSERWKIEDSCIADVECVSGAPCLDTTLAEQAISRLAKAARKDELHTAVMDYCFTMESTLARMAGLPQRFQEELVILGEALSKKFEARLRRDNAGPFQTLGSLLTVNAALSRFSSKSLSCTSPILERECHLWTHSLLGIGTASIGLRNLVRFFEDTIGEVRIPQRVLALRHETDSVPNLQTLHGMSLALSRDYLAPEETVGLDDSREPRSGRSAFGDSPDGAVAQPPLQHLVSYFSARDGYRSTERTISAPTSSIDACNDSRWSLMTLTHEVSHVVIRAILADLLGDLEDEKNLAHGLDLLERHEKAGNLHDELRRVLLLSLAQMEAQARGVSATEVSSTRDLAELMRRWERDANETLTHVFDLCYFYNERVDKYITDIWTTWGVIPRMRPRIREYLVRTITAAMAMQLRRGSLGETKAMESIQASLETLARTGRGGRHPKDALEMLECEWPSVIRPMVQARRLLACILACVIYSPWAATKVRAQLGPELKACELSGLPLTNPAHFVEKFSGDLAPSCARSLWTYHALAFAEA